MISDTKTQPPTDSPPATAPAADGSKGGGVLTFLGNAAQASLILAALLYVIGWYYLDGYYQIFNLHVGQLGISNQEFMIKSFKYLLGHPARAAWYAVLAILVGIAAEWLYGLVPQRQNADWLRKLIVSSFILLVVFLSVQLVNHANQLGSQDAWNDVLASGTKLPRVEVEVDPMAVSEDLVRYQDLENKEYVMLLQTEDQVWLFKPTADNMAQFSVVSLPRSAVHVVSLQRDMPGGAQ